MSDDPTSDEPTIAAGPVLRAGRRMFQRYTLSRMAGRGGMGVVWEARDERLDRTVALKFLPEVLFLDSAARDDLKRETRRSLDLTHPHIVRIHDFVEDEEAAAIAMEYVDGPTLSQLRVDRPSRVFETQDLEVWTSALCSALDYAHHVGRCVHRDLKPGNLMVSSRGVLKVSDFGIACGLHHTAARVSMWTSTGGTLGYMSPQQLLGELASPSDDIYSIGSTLYELLTGKPPFYSGDISTQVRERRPDSVTVRRGRLGLPGSPIPSKWEQVIAACLEKDASARPRTAGDIARFLGLPTASMGEIAPSLHEESAATVSDPNMEARMSLDEPAAEITTPEVPSFGEFVSRNRWQLLTAAAVMVAVIPWAIIAMRPRSIEKVTVSTPAPMATPVVARTSEVPGLPVTESPTAQTPSATPVATPTVAATPAPAPTVSDRSFVDTQPAATPTPTNPSPATNPPAPDTALDEPAPAVSMVSNDGPLQVEVASSPLGLEFQIMASAPVGTPETVAFRGKTPTVVTTLAPGTYHVNFNIAGQPPRSETLEMADQGHWKVQEQFPSGTVKVSSQPSGAEVLCDGRSMGQTPLDVELLPGKHEIGARWQGKLAKPREVMLEVDEQEEISFNFRTGTSTGQRSHRPKPTPAPSVWSKMGKSISNFFTGGDKKKKSK